MGRPESLGGLMDRLSEAPHANCKNLSASHPFSIGGGGSFHSLMPSEWEVSGGKLEEVSKRGGEKGQEV